MNIKRMLSRNGCPNKHAARSLQFNLYWWWQQQLPKRLRNVAYNFFFGRYFY